MLHVFSFLMPLFNCSQSRFCDNYQKSRLRCGPPLTCSSPRTGQAKHQSNYTCNVEGADTSPAHFCADPANKELINDFMGWIRCPTKMCIVWKLLLNITFEARHAQNILKWHIYIVNNHIYIIKITFCLNVWTNSCIFIKTQKNKHLVILPIK